MLQVSEIIQTSTRLEPQQTRILRLDRIMVLIIKSHSLYLRGPRGPEEPHNWFSTQRVRPVVSEVRLPYFQPNVLRRFHWISPACV